MTLYSKPATTRTPRARSTGALVVLTGLLMPGGSLLLAWMLGRHLLSRVNREAAKRFVQTAALIVFLQGCATQFEARQEVSQNPMADSAVPELHFQNPSAEPVGKNAFVSADQLRPGDILLTSMPGIAAAGIELLTTAPVSHAAVYVGEGRVIEAVRSGVRTRSIEQIMAEESIALVLRYPGLSHAQAGRIREYAQHKLGAGFSFFGVTMQAPYSISRKACELPLVAAPMRDACIRAMGVFSQLAESERQLFCSQLVLQAYRSAGVPLTDADPRIVSPGDILHMREGDVPSLRIRKALHYVGHLKYGRATVAGLDR